MSRIRGLLIALAAVFAASVAAAPTAVAEPVPPFDFTDCPTLPAGADPAKWRCEVLIAHGTVHIGRLPSLPVSRIRTVFAEGQLDGKFAQVFGSMVAEPVSVPGGLLGVPGNPLLRLDLRIEYAGYADFLSVGDRMGEQHLKLAVISPLVPPTCTIGSNADPIKFKPVRTSGPTVISPGVLKFSLADTTFSVPRTYGCGAFGPLLTRRLGVPSGQGNELSLTSYVGIR